MKRVIEIKKSRIKEFPNFYKLKREKRNKNKINYSRNTNYITLYNLKRKGFIKKNSKNFYRVQNNKNKFSFSSGKSNQKNSSIHRHLVFHHYYFLYSFLYSN